MNLLRTMMLAGLALAGNSAVIMVTSAPLAAQSEIRIQTRLAGGPLNGVAPSGNSRFRAKGGHSNFSVEVEDVNLPDGTVLTVTINGSAAGSIRLALRGGEIDVNTKDGDSVPQAKAGDTVTVTGPSGAILSGVLR